MKRLHRQSAAPGTEAHNSNDQAASGDDRIRAWIIGLVLVICPVLFLGLYYKTTFGGLVNPDALDFAQLGRNLSSGRGFVTDILRPLALSHGHNSLQQPDVTHGPLYPFLLSVAFGVLHPSDRVVAGVSAVFYLLTVPLIYLFGTRMFSQTIGIIAALIFAVNSLMLQYAVSGLPLTLEIFLTTALLFTLYSLAASRFTQEDEAPRKMPTGLLCLTGLLTGALYLTDPIFVWVFPIVAGFVIWLFSMKRWQALAYVVGLFCLVSIPWMARNAVLTGNPVFGLRGMDILAFTSYYPGDIIYRMAPTDVVPGREIFVSVILKIASGLGNIVDQTPQIAASWVLAFFLPSLFFRFADKSVNATRAVSLMVIGAVVVGMLPFDVALHMPILTCVVPVLLIFSVAYLTYLAQQARLDRRAMALTSCLIAVAVIYPVINAMFLSGTKPQPVKEEASAKDLGAQTAKDDVSLSDQPWIPAWYANRPSIWIPSNNTEVQGLRDNFHAHWLFLTDQAGGCGGDWARIQSSFQYWNVAWQQREAANQPEVPKVSIKSDGSPLFTALQGFTAVPPLPEASPSTVIANLPQPAQQTGPTAQNRSAEPSAVNQVARAADGEAKRSTQ